MKKAYIVACLIALTIGFTSCADKITDSQSEMKGGEQGPAPGQLYNYSHDITPSNTNGMGQPLAGGIINTKPDTMWNQNSPFEGKPF